MDDDGLDEYREHDQSVEGRIIWGAGVAMFVTATGMLVASFAALL
jgi:hypothetical protein